MPVTLGEEKIYGEAVRGKLDIFTRMKVDTQYT